MSKIMQACNCLKKLSKFIRLLVLPLENKTKNEFFILFSGVLSDSNEVVFDGFFPENHQK
ncbi:MAG: hypothetical protein AAF847_19525 [Bacteroidota bacterium]